MENGNQKILKKRIDKIAPYTYAMILQQIKDATGYQLSEECNALFFQLIKQIQNECNCLKCDELTDCHIIEEGFNRGKNK